MTLEIIPGLYLGNIKCAFDEIFIQSRNIHIILNITTIVFCCWDYIIIQSTFECMFGVFQLQFRIIGIL